MARALVVSTHPDDAEIGMGGTIRALAQGGHELLLVDLSDGEPTPFGTVEKRKAEAEEAARILNVKREQLGLTNREIVDSVESRKKLASVYRSFKPEVLFVPYWEDAHPDHCEACKLCEAARFYSKFVKSDMPHSAHYPRRIFHYFALHLRSKYQPALVFDVSSFIEAKMEALRAYRSQFLDNPLNAAAIEQIRTWTAHWGAEIGASYGEPFACRENIRLISTESLLNA